MRRRLQLGMLVDRRGIVAVEFALLAPFLLALLFGLFEVSSLVRASLKLSHAANNLAKIVSQQQPPADGSCTSACVTPSQLKDFCTGAGDVLSPYATGSLAAAVVSVTSAKGGAATKDWEYDAGCPAAASTYASSAATLAGPTGSGGYGLTPNAGDSVVVVRASYTYKPVLHYLLGSSWTLTQTAFARPRVIGTIQCAACS